MKKNIGYLFIAMTTLAACTPSQPTVAITSPSARVYTNGSVSIQVTVTNDPTTVELLKDDTVLATLTAPYQFTWDTTSQPEATYNITARASKNGLAVPVVSAAQQITVDRTAPTISSRSPINAATNALLADMNILFSESMLPSSVTAASVQLQQGGNPMTRNATFNPAGTKLSIMPTALPTFPAALNLSLNGLTDLAGNLLPNNAIAFSAPDWVQPGTQPLDIIQTENSGFSEIATSANGEIFVIFREFTTGSNRNVYVKKWTGSTWESLGAELDIVPANTFATNPDIAVQSNGNPIVTWNENANNGATSNIYVKRWTGTTWESLGTELDVTLSNDAIAPKIVLNSSNDPIVVWAEGGVRQVFVKRWNGTTWDALGGALNINVANGAADPRISIFNNQPVVTWLESSNIYVKRWDGSAWQPLGAALNTATSFDSDVIVAPDGNPIVVWNDNNDVIVKKYDGTNWQPLGAALDLVIANAATLPKIDVDLSGNPIVVWIEAGKAVVKKWNGSAWVSLGGNVNTGTVSNPKIATDTNGNPVISYTENTDIFVSRFNGIR